MSTTSRTTQRRLRVLLAFGCLLFSLLLPSVGHAAATATSRQSLRSDPLAGDRFWVSPYMQVVQEERDLFARGRSVEARRLSRIASRPEATWFAGPVSTAFVRQITLAAQARGEVSVDAMYDLPWRGCGQPGAGGAATPALYRQNVDRVAKGLGQAKVVMVVEPDALAEMSCFRGYRRTMYFRLIRYAIRRFERDRNAALYVDAGHPEWDSPRLIAKRLMRVARQTRVGFSLNVSNYYSTAANVAWGTAISRLTRGKHFVIDTSRNGGHVSDNEWCNPPGAKIGRAPTSRTGNPLLDAELWIKSPGLSDGTCDGGPPAGTFWLRQALAES